MSRLWMTESGPLLQHSDLDKNAHANANIDRRESEAAVVLQNSQAL